MGNLMRTRSMAGLAVALGCRGGLVIAHDENANRSGEGCPRAFALGDFGTKSMNRAMFKTADVFESDPHFLFKPYGRAVAANHDIVADQRTGRRLAVALGLLKAGRVIRGMFFVL